MKDRVGNLEVDNMMVQVFCQDVLVTLIDEFEWGIRSAYLERTKFGSELEYGVELGV